MSEKFVINENKIMYTFETEWDAPKQWFMQLYEKYPDYNMRLEYNEPNGE